jgi:ABC-type dipeptide/oligopeptide/nickel transport system ATPase component
MKEILLQVENLAVGFHTYRGDIQAVRKISYNLYKGEVLGIVGESGCGKSVSVHAIMQILPEILSLNQEGLFSMSKNCLVLRNLICARYVVTK